MPVSINGNGHISGLAVGGLGANVVNSTSLHNDAVTSAHMPSNTIVQVVQTFKNNTDSTSSGSFADISGFTVSITPSATSSKILYSGHLYLGFSGAEGNFRLTRTVGGTATEIGNSSVVDDDADGAFAIGGGSQYTPATFSFLDSPNTTSATTYKMQWKVESSHTFYLNRCVWDTDNSGYQRTVSMIMAQEVSA